MQFTIDLLIVLHIRYFSIVYQATHDSLIQRNILSTHYFIIQWNVVLIAWPITLLLDGDRTAILNRKRSIVAITGFDPERWR